MEKYMEVFWLLCEISQFTLRFLLKKLNCGFYLPFPLKKHHTKMPLINFSILESSYILPIYFRENQSI